MNDNYLWDRSGEPDPTVQELEEILGTLRYQPRALEIPNDIGLRGNRTFLAKLAIAAAIGLFAIAFGLWVNFNRHQTVPAVESRHDSPAEQKKNDTPAQSAPNTGNGAQLAVVKKPTPANVQKRRRDPGRTLVAQNKNPDSAPRPSTLTPQELAEKEQVLLALRLVSAKLNLAQRKTQGLPQSNLIRNQHKIG